VYITDLDEEMELRNRYGLPVVYEPTASEWSALLGLKRGRDRILKRDREKDAEEIQRLKEQLAKSQKR
jgi:hypothetical protein